MVDEQKPDSSCTQSGAAYRVEVRATVRPLVYDGDKVIGREWVELPTIKIESPFGVARLSPADELTYTLGFHGALALAASFHSHHERHYGLECRLVEYRRVITHTLTKVGEQTMLDAVHESFAIAAESRGDER